MAIFATDMVSGICLEKFDSLNGDALPPEQDPPSETCRARPAEQVGKANGYSRLSVGPAPPPSEFEPEGERALFLKVFFSLSSPPKGISSRGKPLEILSGIAFNGLQSLGYENIRQENSPMDLSKLEKKLLERLESLAAAGLTHLPRGKSRVEFSFQKALASETQTSPNAVRESAGITEIPALVHQPAPPPDFRSVGNSPITPKPSIAKPISPTALNEEVDLRPYGPSCSDADRLAKLNSLAHEVAGCSRCNVLSACRKQTVFGVGNVRPRLLFFGEAPGADEDRVGEPFVGAAGQLLDKIITACKMNREDVYILNTVKCRPPDNRNPTAQEMANCWDYAERQFEILQPEFICCLGRVAAQKLLKTDSHIGPLRGKFFKYRGSQVIVTYHPAYLLRTESAKKLTWDDMRMLMSAMGIAV